MALVTGTRAKRRPSPLEGKRFLCCPWCEREWDETTAPASCPECFEPLRRGHVGTALRSIAYRGGL